LVSEIQTTPPTGAVQLAPTPGLLEKSDIGFYSQLEAAVQPLQNKGTGQQYLAQIQKSAGVKPEEIQWTGLDEFLKSKQSVTKQEIQDYLQANRVDVQEVRLTGDPRSTEFDYATADDYQQAIWDAEDAGDLDTARILQQDLEAFQAMQSAPSEPTKFSKFTLPGGENYREILLTLPQKNPEFDPADLGRLTELSNKTRTPAETEEYRALAQRYDASLRGETTREYRSSHFDQPNILAHLRVNDRTVDGKKTLFVEEIQSDWHQAGRKQGYFSKSKLDALDTKLKANGSLSPEDASEYNRLVDLESMPKTKGGVPDAPFKTTWHELSLKRAIQEAAEKGYDQIAFTTGKTQAERYDLSQQIDEINVVGRTDALTGEQTKSVALDTTGGQSLRFGINKDGIVDNVSDSNMSNFIGKGLDEVIGKDLAKKIMDGGSQTISGEGLKVGGEGMKGFYDNILPKSLDKLGKKFGAKVGKTDMDGVEVWQMDITPQMRESVVTKGQPLFAIPAIGAGLLGAGMMQEEETY